MVPRGSQENLRCFLGFFGLSRALPLDPGGFTRVFERFPGHEHEIIEQGEPEQNEPRINHFDVQKNWYKSTLKAGNL